MSEDAQQKADAIGFLRDNGFNASEIHTSNESGQRRPDILAIHGHQRYVIECKRKLTDATLQAQLASQVACGGVALLQEPTERLNVVAAVLAEAAVQLDAYCQDDDLRVVWIDGEGWHPALQRKQFRSSFFGIREIRDRSPAKDHRDCYYFGMSDAFRHCHSIDMVVSRTDEQAELLVNNFSPRYVVAVRSHLVQLFGTAALDPLALEKTGDIYLVDGNVDRRDSKVVIDYVRKKYGKQTLLDFEMKAISWTVAVPRNSKTQPDDPPNTDSPSAREVDR